MRKLILALAPALLLACEPDIVSVQTDDPLTNVAAAVGAPVRAAVDTVIDACSGEQVMVRGTAHVRFSLSMDPNGGTHLVFHLDQTLQGTGLTSGANYNHNSVGNFTLSNLILPWEQTSVSTLAFIGQGTVENLNVRRLQHITLDANGNLRVWHDQFRAVCG